MATQIRFGISTCPNDTFAIHAILQRKVDLRGIDFRIDLMDVQQLNEGLISGQFDVAKASFHAALLLADEVGVLSSGSALGFGVGPLLLASRSGLAPGDRIPTAEGAMRPARVLCPGRFTTATLLYELFHPHQGRVEQVVFSEIMPALEAGAAEFGVCIHEGRFTWQERGLARVEDLGTTWENATGAPLPLGGIVARRRLPASCIQRVQAVLRDSIEYGLAHRDETLATMRTYAQELSDDVLLAHVDLYVNPWTVQLGPTGRSALDALWEQAQRVGLVPRESSPLQIFE